MSESSRSIAPNRSQGFSAGTCVGKLLFFTFEENLTIWALYAEPGLFLYLLARYPRHIGQWSRSFCSGIFHLAHLPTLRPFSNSGIDMDLSSPACGSSVITSLDLRELADRSLSGDAPSSMSEPFRKWLGMDGPLPARIQPGSIDHVPFPTVGTCIGASLALREKARSIKKSFSSRPGL
ncbi:hypothetical protein L1987_45954 [Smallanthus sonchifolius]|uniref:Uncharacterized protein n=1 Tax=Smallanthus sonchifolius TaxID=185202 RepID=A0ACB9FY92_9ASTR|nr:hypothetical protein L1987_45954 [Smallanthus sonchifolius]